MKRLLRHDTVAGRLALAVMLAMSAAGSLNLLFIGLGGVWARPDLVNSGLLQQAATLTQVISATPVSLRPQLTAAAGNGTFKAEWLQTIPMLPDRQHSADTQNIMRTLLQDPKRRTMTFESPTGVGTDRNDKIFGAAAYGMAVSLNDGTWLVFKVSERRWGLRAWKRDSLILAFILLSTFAISLLAARSLVNPVEAFAEAARRFGSDPKAPPMVERGPRELRVAAMAFNAMQTQIQRFVTDRTDMLAAISHDLRTPLTRVRLRGEFIDDKDQQHRLFRDVEEMQAMIDSALALFHDEVTEERPTSFDLSELVRLVIDDLADQGKLASFDGRDNVIYHGRPFALKRAFGNIVENACAYAGCATASLAVDHHGVMLSVRDIGPGIPEPLLDKVFSPFYRVERSRNRQTGGVGLGLTSARTIVRAHGGDIKLRNHQEGGLLVLLTLPPAVFPTVAAD